MRRRPGGADVGEKWEDVDVDGQMNTSLDEAGERLAMVTVVLPGSPWN